MRTMLRSDDIKQIGVSARLETPVKKRMFKLFTSTAAICLFLTNNPTHSKKKKKEKHPESAREHAGVSEPSLEFK